jgi:hypothetical protein
MSGLTQPENRWAPLVSEIMARSLSKLRRWTGRDLLAPRMNGASIDRKTALCAIGPTSSAFAAPWARLHVKDRRHARGDP